tara:strand:- start:7006 stop:8073 length:1068 start_codon:yes stop_codon:yes gene_type:complete
MSKLVILQTCAPDYRKKFFDQITSTLGEDFILMAGKNYFEPTVKTNYAGSSLKMVNNHFLLNRKILIQTGIWTQVFEATVMVMEMNPRIITNWIILLIRRLLRKQTVLWGHAWPRGGETSKSDWVRNVMRLFANQIIVYTNRQAEELKQKMPNKVIKAAPNAVMFSSEMLAVSTLPNEVNDFIYVGRLTPSKNVRFLVDSFIEHQSKFNEKSRLLLVGDGEEMSGIKKIINQHFMRDRVIVFGHISDFEILSKLYSTCICSLSPGYIGLSVTQSFGMGVPMLISRNENHSPEIEAVKEGVNGEFFESGNSNNLINGMLSFLERKKYWLSQKKSIAQSCRENYSIENMASVFIKLI